MSKIFTHTAGYVIYDDTILTNNPSKQFGNWKTSNYNIEVTNPSGPQAFEVLPGATITPFSGTRSLGMGFGTTFALALNPVKANTYRLTHDGLSAFTGFRVARSATLLNGNPLTITINNAAVATFSSAITTASIGMQVGDEMFIPSTSSGDAASVFSEQNVGYWKIISVGTTSWQAIRPAGTTFNGVAEVVTMSGLFGREMFIYSAGPTQVGDTFRLTAGNINGFFEITALNENWIEFVSAKPLPLNYTLNVGTSFTSVDLVVFAFAKKWIRIESDQEVVLQFNGTTDTSLLLVPRTTLSNQSIAWYDSWGVFWSLSVINQSTSNTCNLVISTVE